MVRRIVFVLLTAGPALAVAGWDASGLLMSTVSDHPRWPDLELNLSEAAAVRDHAEVTRLIERGDDPNARLAVRPGLLGNDNEVPATPLEAAISERRPELVDMLLEQGARPSSEDWLRLRCVAEQRNYTDIVAVLDVRRPDGVEIRCLGTESLW